MFLLCMGALYMSAVNVTPDTIPAQELHKIIIEASNQDVSPSVSTHYPGIKQKNAANSAITLLGLMAIPQLDVDMGASSVKTLGGQGFLPPLICEFLLLRPTRLDMARKLTDTMKLRKVMQQEVQS